MRLSRMNRYRPTRTADGEGGFTVALGTAASIWGAAEVHEARITLVTRAEADVQVEDVVTPGGLQYRVIGDLGPIGAPYKRFEIERIERPITESPS